MPTDQELLQEVAHYMNGLNHAMSKADAAGLRVDVELKEVHRSHIYDPWRQVYVRLYRQIAL